MSDPELDALSRQVGAALAQRGWRLATAESCTGGWIAEALTAISGSSAWFDRGFVTYSNEAKTDMLGVAAQTLAAHGAVSETTVREMAEGALARSLAEVAVAVSGCRRPHRRHRREACGHGVHRLGRQGLTHAQPDPSFRRRPHSGASADGRPRARRHPRAGRPSALTTRPRACAAAIYLALVHHAFPSAARDDEKIFCL